jgi:TolA-binding protein
LELKHKGEKMRLALVVFSLMLFSGVAAAQTPAKQAPAPTTPPTAAPAPTKPIPQLTEEEKTQVLFLQRNITRIDLNIVNEQKQEQKFQNDLYTLAQNIQKRLGPGFVVDPDTLTVSVAPTPAPAPDAKK